jgi:hypothetical protein
MVHRVTSAVSVICVRCGRAPSGDGPVGSAPNQTSPSVQTAAVTAGWLREVGADGAVTWVCPDCVRRHIRSIEARLDDAWW